MTTTTATASAILRPEDVAELLVLPTMEASVAGQVCTIVTTASKTFRIPRVAADPSAQWVAEGDEIAPSDVTLDEVDVTPAKVAGLTIITSELAADSTPEAAAVVGDGLARDIARKVDAAFFGKLVAPAPQGLGWLALTGADKLTSVAAGTEFTGVDPFLEALAAAENVGTAITAFIGNPADVLTMAKIKKATGSNEPLLGSSATAATERTIAGVPLIVSPAVTAGTIWGVPRTRCYLVVREDATVLSDTSVFFTSDRVAVRATMRVGIGMPHPAAVVKITKGA